MKKATTSGTALALLLAAGAAHAGGGPMNVLVLYSADDGEATAVAHHYEAARSLPPGHLCGLAGFTPAMTSIDAATYASAVQAPLDGCLAALAHPDEIDYLVLVRGLPYEVTLPSYTASLEAVLQVHHTLDAGTMMELAGAAQPSANASVQNPGYPNGYFSDPKSPIKNQYSAWYWTGQQITDGGALPPAFRRAGVADQASYGFAENLFIVQSLDGFDYEDAKALVDRAVLSEAAPPTGELLCMRGEDEARAARDPECELVTRMLKSAGFPGVFVDPFDGALAGHTVMGYFTGSSDTVRNAIAGNTFAPGAITDNLTSYGAAKQNFFCNQDGTTCPAGESQTSIARFVRAGATGAHGTVNEPYNNVFPNAGSMLLYTFGYSMGEAYFYSQRYLYWQNIHLGDPLASPYATRPAVTFAANQPSDQPLTVEATHPAGIAKIDLYSAGARVASATGDKLEWAIPDPEGTTLDLLAVAVANNVVVERAGWASPMASPRTDVQGWKAQKVMVTPPKPISGTGGGGSGSGGSGGSAGSGGNGSSAEGESGCGCGAVGSGSNRREPLGALVLLALAALARQRVGVARRPRRG